MSLFGGAMRQSGGGQHRFAGTAPHGDRAAAALRRDHPAVVDGRTLFPKSVVNAEDAPRLLVSGINSAKLGRMVTKGSWKGLPIFGLTLEERKTCPTSCAVWRECFGNAMPFARRHRHGPVLEKLLATELAGLLWEEHRRGIVVRLHVLGDFYSSAYVAVWERFMRVFPALRVFGYTAHPAGSPIGQDIRRLNRRWPERWVIRYSVAATAPIGFQQAAVLDRKPEARVVPEGIVCPAAWHEEGGPNNRSCATCGLCWAPTAFAKRIVFPMHGKVRSTGSKRSAYDTDAARAIAQGGGYKAVAARMGFGEQAIRRYAKTGYVPPESRQAFDLATVVPVPSQSVAPLVELT